MMQRLSTSILRNVVEGESWIGTLATHCAEIRHGSLEKDEIDWMIARSLAIVWITDGIAEASVNFGAKAARYTREEAVRLLSNDDEWARIRDDSTPFILQSTPTSMPIFNFLYDTLEPATDAPAAIALQHGEAVAGMQTLAKTFGWCQAEVRSVAGLLLELGQLNNEEQEWLGANFGHPDEVP